MAASVVVPVDVFEGGELDVALSPSRAARVDELPFEQAVEALDHDVGHNTSVGPSPLTTNTPPWPIWAQPQHTRLATSPFGL